MVTVAGAIMTVFEFIKSGTTCEVSKNLTGLNGQSFGKPVRFLETSQVVLAPSNL